MEWRNRPKFIDYCPSKIDYVLFIDENGSGDLKDIIKNPIKYKDSKEILTITGVSIKATELKNAKNAIMDFKLKYWPNALFKYKDTYKRVCLHSREIRKKEGPFNPKLISYDDFIIELSDLMSNLPFTIFSSSIDKVKHYHKYYNPVHPYNLSLNFILERFVKYFLSSEETAIVVIEARGKDHDIFTLRHIKDFMKNGNYYVTPKQLSKIKGVFFNQKWCKSSNDMKSYFGLEITDLCSYPIHKYVKYNIKDRAFLCIESKIYGFPNYLGHGIKIFP